MATEKGTVFVLTFAIVTISISAIIGLTLYFTIREKETARTGFVADCWPSGFGTVDKNKCEDKGSVYYMYLIHPYRFNFI